MVGGPPSEGADEVEKAEQFIVTHPLRGLSGYLAIGELMGALLSTDQAAEERLREAATRHERSGDALVQAVALMAGSVLDLRAGSAARAQVRSSLAEALCRGLTLTTRDEWRACSLMSRVSSREIGSSPGSSATRATISTRSARSSGASGFPRTSRCSRPFRGRSRPGMPSGC